jgi:exo-beta-1,3-glucanase (GH17 family)
MRRAATATLKTVLLLAATITAGRAAADPSPFLTYLRRDAPPPALIAYNPSRYDPERALPATGYPTEDIRADLVSLRPGFDGLVLYAFIPGVTPVIVATAAELGYQAVLLGIWTPQSAVEREGVADLVTRYHPRLAFAVVIGNEGLNDARYSLDDIVATAADLQRRLPSGVRVPVTTSEPAGDYGWPPLRAFGDFLAPNIHPALDRGNLAPAEAAAWVRHKAQVIACAARRPVLVKETGVPHGGNDRFSPAGQAAFWTALLAPGVTTAAGDPPCPPPLVAQADGWASFATAFEAFDAPWKAAQLQSPLEGYWGLLAIDRRAYPAFTVFAQR